MLPDPNKPATLAREALKRLVRAHLEPTPENFQHFYTQIRLEQITPDESVLASSSEIPLSSTAHKPSDAPPSWLAPLLTQWVPVAQTETLTQALGDVKWLERLEDIASSMATYQECLPLLREQVVALLNVGEDIAASHEQRAFPPPTVSLLQEIREVRQGLTTVRDAELLKSLLIRLISLRDRLSIAVAEQVAMQPALLDLLRLVVDNVQTIAQGDEWLTRQMDQVSEALDRPMKVEQIDRLKHHLQAMINKQRALKNNLTFARERMKDMLSGFMSHLMNFTQDTEDYQEKLKLCAEKIRAANDIEELSNLVQEVVQQTEQLQTNVKTSHEQMQSLRLRALAAEHEMARLQNELAQNSELIRLDPLTGVLNRKGMQEAIYRALQECRTYQQALSCCMLDIDNFKHLNDTYGHQAGDEALVLIARVICEHATPKDSVVRYGGEEFFILFPGCTLAHAEITVKRIRDSLARRALVYQRQTLPLTFSAGVAEIQLNDDNAQQAIQKADEALYAAKRSGKDRIVCAGFLAAA